MRRWWMMHVLTVAFSALVSLGICVADDIHVRIMPDVQYRVARTPLLTIRPRSQCRAREDAGDPGPLNVRRVWRLPANGYTSA